MRIFRGRKRKKYRFTDDMMVTDTLISFVFATASIAFTVGCLIYSAIKGGRISDRVGVLLLMSLVMAVTGLGFGLYSFRRVEGDNNAKRMTVILSIVALVLLLVLFLLR
ncbi:MAG: hypothetical protein IJM25_06550 [Eubacterium sp.]|nr:hypothetical protein [Eubacterium sp.]